MADERTRTMAAARAFDEMAPVPFANALVSVPPETKVLALYGAAPPVTLLVLQA